MGTDLQTFLASLAVPLILAGAGIVDGRRVDRVLVAVSAPTSARRVNLGARATTLAVLAFSALAERELHVALDVAVAGAILALSFPGLSLRIASLLAGSPELDASAIRLRWAVLQGRARRDRRKHPDRAIHHLDEALELVAGVQGDDSWNRPTAQSLGNKGMLLLSMGRAADGLETYRHVVAQFGESDDPGLRKEVADALVGTGQALVMLGRSDEGLAAFREVRSRFRADSSASMRRTVATADYDAGVTLGTQGRGPEAIACYLSALEAIGDQADQGAKDTVGTTLVNLCLQYAEQGNFEAFEATVSRLESRLGDSTQPALRLYLCKGRVARGRELAERGRTAEAVVAYDAADAELDSGEPILCEMALMALIAKASLLSEIGQSADSLAACTRAEKFLRRHPDVKRHDDFVTTVDLVRGQAESSSLSRRMPAEVGPGRPRDGDTPRGR
jgi:tetratricopeptide (TPR) repeat protein